MELNLGYNCNFDSIVADKYNDITLKQRGLFTNFISEISKSFGNNIDWWVEGPSSRNTLISPLFHYYCAIILLDKLLSCGISISVIKVDSLAFGKVLHNYFLLKKISIPIKFDVSTFSLIINKYLVLFTKIPSIFSQLMIRKIFAICTKHFGNKIGDSPITIVETFVFPGFINKDRYYNGLLESLDMEKKQEIFFVSSIVLTPIKSILGVISRIRKSNRQFILKEDFLTVSDIIYAVLHGARIFKIKLKPNNVCGVDFSPLITEELRSLRGLGGAVTGILNYLFAKRLKGKNIKLNVIIDWFENQVGDKGWNAGFNKFYPKVQTIGYMGFVPSDKFLCAFPTEVELKFAQLPKRISVMGVGFVDTIKEFCPNLNVNVAPAFRFNYLWYNKKKYFIYCCFTIFIALPISLPESIRIIHFIKSYITNHTIKNVQFLFKLHPASPDQKIITNHHLNSNDNFLLVKGPISDYLRKCDLVVSGMSSICLEAMSLGKPVIIINDKSSMWFNSIPLKTPKSMWQVCETVEEMSNAISYFRDRIKIKDYYLKIGNEIRKEYFAPLESESVKMFLNMKVDIIG